MINKLVEKSLNCSIFDVYDYPGATVTELLSHFFTKINECIDVSNETLELAEWLMNKGLSEEVSKQLVSWLNEGVFEGIINESIFNDLNSKIEGIDTNIQEEINIRDINIQKYSEGEDITTLVTSLNNKDNVKGYFPKGRYTTTTLPIFKCYGEGVLIYNGEEIKLSNIPEYVNNELNTGLRHLNVFIGNDCGNNTNKLSRGNTGLGANALQNSTTSVRNTGIGKGALAKQKDQYSNTAIGTDSMGCSDLTDRNVGVGSNAMKWCGTTTPVEDLHEFFTMSDPFGLESMNPNFRVLVGTTENPRIPVLSKTDNCYNVAIGRNALVHGLKSVSNTVIGYNAMAHGYENQYNTAIGKGALQCGVKCDSNTAIGYDSLYSNQEGLENTGIGNNTLRANVKGVRNVAIGNQALQKLSDSVVNNSRLNTVIGWNACSETMTGAANTHIGASSGVSSQGKGNVGVGASSLQNNTLGNYNTALGYNALMLNIDGTATTEYSNIIGIGANARVSGSNQCQIGDSATTVYTHNTIQSRSDERDKTDIEECNLGLEFINKLNPVSYVWDFRDDYIDVDEEGEVIKHKKDGSRKRKRKHFGLIAQDVENVIRETGQDFGGLQNHNVNGGNDVYTLSYTELISPLIKAIQELTKEVEELKKG